MIYKLFHFATAIVSYPILVWNLNEMHLCEMHFCEMNDLFTVRKPRSPQGLAFTPDGKFLVILSEGAKKSLPSEIISYTINPAFCNQ